MDILINNAGIMPIGPFEDQDDALDRRVFDINVHGVLNGVRAVLPGMLARKAGYLLQTVSAAGLLTSIGSAPYAVTKHAALGLAEWLSITYGDQGVRDVLASAPLPHRQIVLLARRRQRLVVSAARSGRRPVEVYRRDPTKNPPGGQFLLVKNP